jgi:hypothetical protein
MLRFKICTACAAPQWWYLALWKCYRCGVKL